MFISLILLLNFNGLVAVEPKWTSVTLQGAPTRGTNS